MRIHRGWMKAPDPYLLEYLEEEGIASPTDISEDDRLHFDRTYINKRLKALENNGMTQNVGNGMYRITERGSQWLAGEYDPQGNTAEASA